MTKNERAEMDRLRCDLAEERALHAETRRMLALALERPLTVPVAQPPVYVPAPAQPFAWPPHAVPSTIICDGGNYTFPLANTACVAPTLPVVTTIVTTSGVASS